MVRGVLAGIKALQTHNVFVRIILPPYTIHFKSPNYMKESTLEVLDNRICKEVVKSSASFSEVRDAIGTDTKFWTELVLLLRAAVISLERRSFQIWDPSGADYESTSGALIASNYPGLWKDLERLNNLVSIARNVLTAGEHVQDLAAEYGIEHEIFKLINCAVRVTARGYDGEAGTGDEEKWQFVVNTYKKLLITCLQFLNNIVAQNERRKLMLWVNLFDNSDALFTSPPGQVVMPARLMKKPECPTDSEDILLAYGKNEEKKLSLEGQTPLHADKPFMPIPEEVIDDMAELKPNGYVYFGKKNRELIYEQYQHYHKRPPTMAEIFGELPRRWAALSADNRAYWQKKYEAALKKSHIEGYMFMARDQLLEGCEVDSRGWISPTTKGRPLFKPEDEFPERYEGEASSKALDSSLYCASSVRWTEPGDEACDDIEAEDMKMAFTADAGNKILESGKAELMKRLEGYDKHEEALDIADFERPQPVPITRRASAPEEGRYPIDYNDPNAELWSVASDEPRVGSEVPEEEDDYPGSTEDGRGLLTDVPLILGPSEIEVLPMIVMSGIVPNPSQLAQCNGNLAGFERNALINLHTVRCHLLLAQENGRNLLRELLIFVAAWDSREEELYFKFMVKIMEAILANGLMPYAYHAFRDRSRSKDIISPAQAVIMKLLTNIFRARSETHKANTRPGTKPTLPQTSHSLLPSTPQRVDLHILNYIFTEFRQHIIPQTCALIFLQGQIHHGRASPDDFPLNLWDMERMYEGVYQYLEFFAVLTEEAFWKGVLGRWHIASELVTLLRELEGGIPKMQLTAERLPRDRVSVPQRANSADARVPSHAGSKEEQTAYEQPFEAETPLAYPEDPQDEPSDFEWRNLKKLTVLVLSSLIWKNKLVQDQIRMYGGLEALVACCKQDEHNPYIREHAIMCLRFAVEENTENAAVIRKMAAQRERHVQAQGEHEAPVEDVPREVLDANGYETFMDGKGQIGLRRKEQLPTVPTLASSVESSRVVLPPMQTASGMAKLTPEKAAELMQNALKELPLGMGANLAKGLEGLIKSGKL